MSGKAFEGYVFIDYCLPTISSIDHEEMTLLLLQENVMGVRIGCDVSVRHQGSLDQGNGYSYTAFLYLH